MINPAIEDDLKRMSLNDVNYADYIKENYVPIEVLQEIRAELTKHYVDPYNRNAFRYTTISLLDVLDIIDTHISALNKEMKQRKIGECPKDCLSCSNSFSESSDNGEDILHCMEKDGEIVSEDGYCEKYN